jgi:hypothetical protein
MGFSWQSVPGVNVVGDAVTGKWGDLGKNAVSGGLYGLGNTLSGEMSPTDPTHGGVVAPADPNAVARLQQQPDGSFVDPATGQTYSDATGKTPIQAPAQTALVSQNNNAGQNLYSQLGQSQGQVNGAVNGLGQLVSGPNGLQDTRSSFQNTINNPNAPSVAQAQLGSGLDSAVSNQRSQAAAATGGNSFLAGRNAANNIAGLNSATNQQKVQARDTEVAQAQQGLLSTNNTIGSVVNNQGQLGQGMYGANLGGSTAYANLANQGRANQDSNNLQYALGKANANTAITHDLTSLATDAIPTPKKAGA